MIEAYYKRPILFDYIASSVIIGGIVALNYYSLFNLPDADKSIDFASDVAAIGLTVSGFILTLITILITFKSGQLLSEEGLTNGSSPFKIFLASSLYNKSVSILKYGVLSLVIVSFFLYALKLFLSPRYLEYVFYSNVLGLVIMLATFVRCFYVLGIIMRMQNNFTNDTL